ncbi:MAG: MBL fold metallo-hydrolase [Chloroflexota bacterium]
MHSISFSRRRLLAAAAAVLALGGVAAPWPAAPAEAQSGTVKLEWLGWSHFRLTSVNGKVILINPFITGNADAALGVDDVTQADLILVADAHRDEIGDSIAIAQKTGAKVFGPGRVVRWLVENGLPETQGVGSNQGDRLRWEGITVRNVMSVHDNSVSKPSTSVFYGGVSSGFVVTFENGWTVYFSGSSAATSDMELWGSMYKPDAMIFHMAGPHDPTDVAMSIKLISTGNPNLKTLLPHHHRVTQGANDTTLDEVTAALSGMGVSIPITNQVRSQVYEFTK